MTDFHQRPPLELKDLENSLDQLILQFNSLKGENQTLKQSQEELLKEKARLIEKTDLARSRINDMIARLKAMEQGS